MPYDLKNLLVFGIIRGGVSKSEVLSAFGAHFFHDQMIHAESASHHVALAEVPYRSGSDPMTR